MYFYEKIKKENLWGLCAIAGALTEAEQKGGAVHVCAAKSYCIMPGSSGSLHGFEKGEGK